MTVIATKDGILCADSMSSMDSTVNATFVEKIIVTRDGWAIGFCGTTATCHALRTMYKTKFNHAKNPHKGRDQAEHCNGLAVNWKGDVMCLDSGGWYPVQAEYYAVGSGSDLAIGAMAMGADAETAVKIAIHHDAFCGGNIVTATPPKPKKKACRKTPKAPAKKSKSRR